MASFRRHAGAVSLACLKTTIVPATGSAESGVGASLAADPLAGAANGAEGAGEVNGNPARVMPSRLVGVSR